MQRRSLFGPFLLIATGLVWLLIELGTIPLENLWTFLYVWPFLLMAAGIGLVLASRWPGTRKVVSGLAVLGLVVAIVFAPQLGWNKAPAWSPFIWSGLGGSIRGSGTVVTEDRELTDFDSLEINYPVELTIRQGSAAAVTVEAEDNLMPQLATRVSGHTLFIENSERDWTVRVNATRPVRIELTVTELQQVVFRSAGSLEIEALEADSLQVTLSGAATITLTDLTVDQLDVSMSGAGKIALPDLSAQALDVHLSGTGDITTSGSAEELSVNISGLGNFQGGDLASQSVDVTISGAGNATVWASESLDVRISGTGSVNYYGSPSVDQHISGLGSVKRSGNK